MEKVEILEKRLESALEIIMEHFHDTEERMEEVERKVEELGRGLLQDGDQ